MATVVECGPLVVDVMCVSVLVGTGLDLDVVNVAGLLEDMSGETEVTESVRVFVGMSVIGMNVIFTEPIVFTGVLFGVPIPVVASVAVELIHGTMHRISGWVGRRWFWNCSERG